MESFFNALGTIFSVSGWLGLLLTWVALNSNQRAELKRILKAIWNHSTKAIPVLMAFLCTAANIWEIYLFGSAESAPTRKDILILLMHIWNACSYFFFGLVLFVFWMKELLAKDYPLQAQT